MAASKSAIRAVCGIAAGAGLLITLVMTSAIAGSASATTVLTNGCSAGARIDAQWGTGAAGGQIVTVTVVNTATTPGTRWTVSWGLAGGQRIVSAWNATVTTTSGTATAVNAPHNGALVPGASTTFGMQLAGIGPAPTLSCANDAVPPTSGPPVTTPPSGADVTVTQADDQSTITLLVGQTLGVSLRADFVPPSNSGPALEHLRTSGGYPTGQPLAALYRAVAPGTVDLTSRTDYACLHATPPCALPTTLWVVHVKVVNPPDSGRTVTVTQADHTSTVNLRVGDTLVVSLPSMFRPPTVSPSGVLVAREVAGGYPTDQPLVARYVPVAAGQVDVSTVSDAACMHQPTPCPTPQVPWRVHVVVAP